MRRGLLALTFLLACAAPASASPSYHPARPDGPWRSAGYSNGYYLQGDPIDWTPSPDDMVLPISVRWLKGMRLYRAVADDYREYRNLRSFARRSPNPGEPTIFCSTGKRSAYMLDLAYWYDPTLYGSLTHAEAHGYRAWAIRYGTAHRTCTVFYFHAD